MSESLDRGGHLPSQRRHPGNLERNQSFSLKNGVAVYGGFAGTESSLAQRAGQINQVVLSADLKGDDADLDSDGRSDPATTSDNAYHVFYHPATLHLDSTALLDSVIVRGGRATDYAGAIYNECASPILAGCTLVDNSATNGGAVYNTSSSPTFTQCIFSKNSINSATGSVYGGVIDDADYSTSTFSNCVFSSNTSTSTYSYGNVYGGIIYHPASTPLTLNSCTFNGNSVSSYYVFGDAIYSNSSAIVLSGSSWSGNSISGTSGTTYGGVIYGTGQLTLSNSSFSNNSISGNTSSISGGVLYCIGQLTLSNCKFSGNSSLYGGIDGGIIYHLTNGPTSLSNCSISGNTITGTAFLSGGIMEEWSSTLS